MYTSIKQIIKENKIDQKEWKYINRQIGKLRREGEEWTGREGKRMDNIPSD